MRHFWIDPWVTGRELKILKCYRWCRRMRSVYRIDFGTLNWGSTLPQPARSNAVKGWIGVRVNANWWLHPFIHRSPADTSRMMNMNGRMKHPNSQTYTMVSILASRTILTSRWKSFDVHECFRVRIASSILNLFIWVLMPRCRHFSDKSGRRKSTSQTSPPKCT